MNMSPLETLHLQFAEALKKHAYMGVSSKTKMLEKTDQKVIHLYDVFQQASKQIDDDVKKNTSLSGVKQVTCLRALEKDGEQYYARYQVASNSWFRSFLKGLAYITPSFLQSYLPGFAAAEKKTKDEYEAYKKLIQGHINQLSATRRSSTAVGNDDLMTHRPSGSAASKSRLSRDAEGEEELNQISGQFNTAAENEDAELSPETQSKSDLFALDVLDDDNVNVDNTTANKVSGQTGKSDPTPAAAPKPPLAPVAPTKEEVEAKNKRELDATLSRIENRMNAFKEYSQFPLSSKKYKALLGLLMRGAKRVMELDPANGKDALQKTGISDADLTVLLDQAFAAAMVTGDVQKLVDLLKATQWNDSFAQAEALKGYTHFGVQKIVGQTSIILKNDKNARIKEADFKTYRGHVKLTLSAPDQFGELAELVKFMTANPGCRPCAIELNVSVKQNMTPELFKLLISLCSYTKEIEINGLEEIIFKGSAITADEVRQFVQHLGYFTFNGLKNVILSDDTKKDWTANEFSVVLALCPTIENLQNFVGLCSTPKEIALPSVLLGLQKVELKGFPVDYIPHLLGQLTQLTEVNLSGSIVTDGQLDLWIAAGLLANVHTLQLSDCKSLTTDVLHSLMTLPKLTSLSLPDLPKGKRALDELPKFDNPFKINFFYTAAKATQPLAAALYTGPIIWAPVFQIPLARQKEKSIFTAKMNTLDPKSVAYWLYNSEYKALELQTAVRYIVADSNAGLTDDNIVEFMQKFPKTCFLSLYNCPNLTSNGIIKLLKACPDILSIDLTDCPQITEDLFSGKGNLAVLQKLEKIIVTGTAIPGAAAKKMQQSDLKGKLEYEETTLTITDADLTDDQALETLLKGKTLTTIKRISLKDCVKLTDQMLGQLLDHLNAEIQIKDKDSSLVKNPQRLNLAVLDLSGCASITEAAFDDNKAVDGKVAPKLLENLDRIVIGGTKIGEVLQGVYPRVTFQETDEPVTMSIDPDAQLDVCKLYYQTSDQNAKRQCSATLVSDRITLELFGSECADKAAVEMVKRKTIDTANEEFCDMTLTFKTTDSANSTVYQVHRDVLYSRSLYFATSLRPGGELSRQAGLVFINVHATPEATQAVIDALYRINTINNLKWKTAADAAELAGPHIFKLSKPIFQLLLARFRSQFDFDNAEKMLTAARLLEDQEGIKQFEKTLIIILDSLGEIESSTVQFRAFANIAKNHNLVELKRRTDYIESRLNRQLMEEVV